MFRHRGMTFPANRENNREFAEFLAHEGIALANSCRKSSGLRPNSRVGRNREFRLREQGIDRSEQGISHHAAILIGAERSTRPSRL
jgi:hypothetical protein